MSSTESRPGDDAVVVRDAHPAEAAPLVTDPGIEEHVPRWTDVNKAAGDRVYRTVVTLFGVVAPLCALAFLVVYFAVPSTMTANILVGTVNAQHALLGLAAGLGLLAVGVGLEIWAKQLMGDEEIAENRHAAASSTEDRETFVAALDKGVQESGVPRRKLLLASLVGGGGMLLLPAIVTLADMGPWPTPSKIRQTVAKTIWAPGVRLVNDVTFEPIKASQMEIGQLVNAQPENLKELHGATFQQEKAKSSLIIVRMDPDSIRIPESRQDWQVAGILAYSKICTHVGCPISLWEQQTHHLLCPCHQSTFDLGNSGVVVFGPAARALPQLPITVDKEGYLIARRDFDVPVGPSYFERDSSGDYKEGDR